MPAAVEPPRHVLTPEEFRLQREAFANRITRGGLNRVQQFQALADTLVPGRFEWHNWTMKIVEGMCHKRWLAISGCAGSAKAQPLDSIVWTPSGPKKMGDIQVGDRVCDANGGESIVEGVFPQGEQDIYEIEFSDGAKVRCTADHLWKVGSSGTRWEKRMKVMPLSEMISRIDAFKNRNEKFVIPKAQPVQMERRKVPIDPYLLGALIGDGCLTGSQVCISSADPEIVQRIRAIIKPPYALLWRSQYDYAITLPGWRWASRTGIGRAENEYKKTLKSLGLWGCYSDQKFIPEDYLYNDAFSRIELVRGLMDTDGTAHEERNSALFSTSSERLAGQFRFLIESLGGACRIQKKPTTYTYRGERKSGKPVYLCTIEHPDPRQFFSLPRKWKKLKKRERCVRYRYIESITKVGRAQAQCIKVASPDSLYLTDHFIVTHNTYNVSNFACLWWLAAPHESSVILCSTTMKMVRKRSWPYVRGFYEAIGSDYGNFVDSRTIWQHAHGDDKHGVFCLAVAEGDSDKVAANIQGIHTRRQMVIVDEAEAVPAAIWKACANLYSYPVDAGGEFVMVAIANARSRLSQFGRFAEPANGYNSVSVDTDEWETKPQMDGMPGLVIRFDFTKSPNIVEGKTVSRHLPSKLRVEAKLRALEARGAMNDPEHYCYDRSFPAPEGLSKTVFTETSLEKHDAYGKQHFTGKNFQIIGTVDPAYTGDRPALRFAAMGEVEGGKMGIESMPPVIIYTDVTSKEPVRYQLIRKIREHCLAVDYRGQKMKCEPRNFGFDASGDGGICDIAEQEWSKEIIRIQYGGSASEDPVSHEDQRPANEVYKNKRAEMYFRSRNAMESGQFKGLDKDTAEELCTLEYSDTRPDGSIKPYVMQDKKEYKAKYTKSPDLADSFVQLIEVARLRGFKLAAKGNTAKAVESVDEIVERAQAVYDTADHAAPEEFVEEFAGE